MKLSNRYTAAQKAMVIYNNMWTKTTELGSEYENLYKRFIEQETKAKVRESMKKGEIYTLEGSDEENDEVNQSIKDIQMNTLLTQEQRRTRVEAEVIIFLNII